MTAPHPTPGLAQASDAATTPGRPALHLILGDGPVGLGVADELARRGLPKVLASRTPPEDPARRARHRRIDARDRAGLIAGTADATHVYATLGLPYDRRVWARDWPPIVENLIAAARANRFRLVFFDNLYAYGPAPLQVPMREDHPQEPTTAKGQVRRAMGQRLMQAARDERLPILLARCGDFYGPGVRNSALYAAAIERQLQGKPAQWLGDPDRPHTFTYTLDAARAMVALALEDDTWGQAWHLPTLDEPATARRMLGLSAAALGAPAAVQVVPGLVRRALAWFVPVLREVEEMRHETTQDYVVSSAKFMRRFPTFRRTPYDEGVAAMAASLRPSPYLSQRSSTL